MELKPCPFCGNTPEQWKTRVDEGGDGCTVFHVGCRNTKCTVKPQSSVCGPWGYRKPTDLPNNDIAEACVIDNWNTRASNQKKGE
jgi:hypothetical protein